MADDEPKRRRYFLQRPPTSGRPSEAAYLPPEKPLDWPPGYVPTAAREMILERHGRGVTRISETMTGMSRNVFTDKDLPAAAMSHDSAVQLFDRQKQIVRKQREWLKTQMPVAKEPEFIPKKTPPKSYKGLDEIEIALWSMMRTTSTNVGDLDDAESDSGDHGREEEAGEAPSPDPGRGDHLSGPEPTDTDS